MIRYIVAALMAIFTMGQIAWSEDQIANLTVKVSGLKNDKGVVRIALFNNEQTYSVRGGKEAFMKEFATIKNGESTYTFAKVPYGTYAIKLFHDEDNSGTLYTNMLGMPKVEFGFSNNAKGSMGPAPFDKAKFEVNASEITQSISVN